jgi:HAD superfamily hydrolase (TIGR01458 family)
MRSIRAMLLDIDGVLTVSARRVAGALEGVAYLRIKKVPLRVLTNTTTRSRATVAEELRRAGFDFTAAEILTSAAATAEYLRRQYPGAKCFLLGEQGDVMGDLDGIAWVAKDDDEADVVVIGGADEAFTFHNLNRALRMTLRGAELVAMHQGLSWMTSEGLCLDAGAYLLGLEAATGKRAVVIGKPAHEFFEAGLKSLGFTPGNVAMVGDDVENDVLAAQSLGIMGILVRTGKFSPEALARASGAPDLVIDSLAQLGSQTIF